MKGMNVNYGRLPLYMQDCVKAYVENGRPGGHFLKALFSNDLIEAVCRADTVNKLKLVEWVRFMQEEMPIGSYGSREAYDQWIAHHGLIGKMNGHPEASATAAPAPLEAAPTARTEPSAGCQEHSEIMREITGDPNYSC